MIVAYIIAGIVLVAVAGLVVFKKRPRKLKTDSYIARWKELQSYCRDKTMWGQAVVEADQLLDSVLKKRRFKGKTMGERMVSAQRSFSDNDGLWFAHNLAKKILAEPDSRLKEIDVKDALVCFRQALRDLGALSNGESRDS